MHSILTRFSAGNVSLKKNVRYRISSTARVRASSAGVTKNIPAGET